MVLLYPTTHASTSSVTLLLPPPTHLDVAASQWNPQDFPSPRELPADSYPFDEDAIKEVVGDSSGDGAADEARKGEAEAAEGETDLSTGQAELLKDGRSIMVDQADLVVKEEPTPTVELEEGEIREETPEVEEPASARRTGFKPDHADTAKPEPTSSSSSSIRLTKAHYHPKVIALAKKLAEKKGMKLLVDGTRRSMLVRYSDPKEAAPNEVSDSHQEARGGPDDIVFVQRTMPQAGSSLIEPAGPAQTSAPISMSESVMVVPSTPTPRNNKKKKGGGGGRWAGHVKATSRADTPFKIGGAPSPFALGTPGPATGLAAAGPAGQGVGEVDVMDEAARAHWEEEVYERRRRDFGMGIGSSSWWNHLLIEARRERGPQWDVNTQSWQVDKGSALYYQSTRSPPKTPIDLPPPSAAEEVPSSDSHEPLQSGMMLPAQSPMMDPRTGMPVQTAPTPSIPMPSPAHGYGNMPLGQHGHEGGRPVSSSGNMGPPPPHPAMAMNNGYRQVSDGHMRQSVGPRTSATPVMHHQPSPAGNMSMSPAPAQQIRPSPAPSHMSGPEQMQRPPHPNFMPPGVTMQQLAQARQQQQQLQQQQPSIPLQHLGAQGGMGQMNMPPHLAAAAAGQMTPSSLVQQAQLARSRELEQFGRLPMSQLQQHQQQQQQQQSHPQQQSSPHQSQQQQPGGQGQLNSNALPFDLNSMSGAQVQMFMQQRIQQQQQQQKLAQMQQQQQLGQFPNAAGMINPQTVAQGMRNGFPPNMQFPPGMQPAQLQQLMNAQMPMGMYGMGGQQGQNPNGGLDPAAMMRLAQQR